MFCQVAKGGCLPITKSLSQKVENTTPSKHDDYVYSFLLHNDKKKEESKTSISVDLDLCKQKLIEKPAITCKAATLGTVAATH